MPVSQSRGQTREFPQIALAMRQWIEIPGFVASLTKFIVWRSGTFSGSLGSVVAKKAGGLQFPEMETEQPTSATASELDPELRNRIFRWLWMWFGRLTLTLVWIWIAFLWLMAFSLRYLGEANLCTAFLLFLPPLLWILPGLVIWPLTLLTRWRAALVAGAVACIFFFTQAGWQIRNVSAPLPRDQRGSDTLLILTNNRGQGKGQSLRPFKNHVQPDIMVFQESSVPASAYLSDPGYAEFKYGATANEFTLISRFPVKPGKLLTWQAGSSARSFHYATRFEMDWNGVEIAVYVVHLKSPREALLGIRWGGFLRGIPLPFKAWSARAEQDMAFWRDQISIAEELERQVSAELLPCVVAGDFNAPHLGAIYRLMTRHLQDAHAKAGHGFGFTFPGDTHNPFSLGGAWLRIDHVLTDSRWEVGACWTEDLRKSQHRAVAAMLRLRPQSANP